MTYQVALITGASTGIGAATARSLAANGVKLILLARRKDKLEQLKQALSTLVPCHVIACDVTDQQTLAEEIAALPEEFAEIDILVNNAGLALGLNAAHETDWADWETMINVNCLGLSYLTRIILPGMVARNRGHIINIGSIAGTYPYKGGNVYGASKAFVEQFSLNLRADLLGTAIRVTSLEPGMVGASEFSLVRFKGDSDKANAVYQGIEALTPDDIAGSISWVLNQPAHVNINRMEIMPVNQAPAGPAYHRE